jgi:Flagellar basal body rod protein
MIRALWTAAAGMNAEQLTVDVIANNLANINTAGFKRSRVDFQDLLYQTERVPGTHPLVTPKCLQVFKSVWVRDLEPFTRFSRKALSSKQVTHLTWRLKVTASSKFNSQMVASLTPATVRSNWTTKVA